MSVTTGLSAQEIEIINAQITESRMKDWTSSYAMIPSRNVNHSGNAYAAKLLLHDLYRANPSLKLDPEPGETEGESPAWVQATLSCGNPTGIVIVSAHLDSTATETSPYEPLIDPAPGADDDASGIAGVLLVALAIGTLVKANPGAQRKEIRFVLFNGEEAQQAGSKLYVEEATNEKIHGVFQMDMIGYAPSNSGTFEIFTGSAGIEGTPSHKLGELVKQIGSKVSSLTANITAKDGHQPGDTSDHVSFYPNFPACLVTETEQNPARHTADDIADTLNPAYAAAIARAVAAAAWHLAKSTD